MTDAPFAAVHRLVRKIPRGRVATYGQLSRLIDGRLTPVGVGWALRAAPDGVPWQRVVNSKGGISTDGDKPGLQRALLEAEGVVFEGDTIDLEKFLFRPTRGRGTGSSRRSSR